MGPEGVVASSGERFDLLVVGSGVAGLSAAIAASTDHEMRVGVVTKGELSDSTTRWAQGGVAAVLSEVDDSVDLHVTDTLTAGVGLCDADAVQLLVAEGPDRVGVLMELGAVFDRDPDGRLEFAREGGHSTARVIHAGGAATGAEVERALDEAARDRAIVIHEHWFAFDLIVEAGRCVGVRGLDAAGNVAEIGAANVLLATGGAGQLFAVTTNPHEATGDGTAMALRAGVAVADVEFMQFHPTALHVARMPRPLLTEALRGHGALLRGPDGQRFTDELAPRDVVSRAETAVMIETRTDHVWLDATALDDFEGRFPSIAADLASVGLDPARDWLPVAPAAHYLSGGVVTDLSGASSLPGLWAAGEAACTGVHGANRLASNSLLEGLVFGPRVVEAIAAGRDGPRDDGAMRSVHAADDGLGVADGDIAGRTLGVVERRAEPVAEVPSPVELDQLRSDLQRAMTFDAGVLRSETSLGRAAGLLDSVTDRVGTPSDPASWELANLCTVGAALVRAARFRTESRGAHTRVDHPETDPALRLRLIQR
ncbi:MAG TPA: FAD-binding protein [Acidimicrobiales bacterium]|nr:FAD-binding protein [Acidimicrobiales bacterium]